MKFKVLFSLATVFGVWWLWLRPDTGVPVLRDRQQVAALPVQKNYPSATPAVSLTQVADLKATSQKLKGMPSKVAVPQPTPNTVNQLAPIPPVASPQPAVSPVVLQPRSLAIDPLTNQLLNALMAAVIGQESSGNHQLEHPISKATGLGQVLPTNIPEWTRETFGRELTVEQFRNSPDAQLYVIRQKLFQYYANAISASGGDLYLAVRRVGAQWYSGQADLYDSTKPVATGPSIRDYTLQVLSRFQNFYPQNYLVRY